MFYWIFTITSAQFIIPFLIWITFATVKFTFTVSWNMFFLCFWFICSCYHCISSVLLRIHILLEKSSRVLQLPLHLRKLAINGWLSWMCLSNGLYFFSSIISQYFSKSSVVSSFSTIYISACQCVKSVRIRSFSGLFGKIRTRKTPNTDSFHAMCIRLIFLTPSIIHFFMQVYVIVLVHVIMSQYVEVTFCVLQKWRQNKKS